jgi:DnaJ like chaperone protein
MTKFGKWIGGGLGWVLSAGSPIGAILGFALGTLIDAAGENINTERKEKGRPRYNTQPGDFTAVLLVLMAAVMKADGKVLKSELNYVKSFLAKHYDEYRSKEMLQFLKHAIDNDFNIAHVCTQVRRHMDLSSKLQLMHLLFELALADGNIDMSELRTLKTIAEYSGISQRDYDSIKAMFIKDTSSAYKILEIDANATDEEVKRAYRRMAVKHHPDKVAHLGEEVQKDAKEKFQKIQQAYESIKKQRGIK